jgi:hypothetical protein
MNTILKYTLILCVIIVHFTPTAYAQWSNIWSGPATNYQNVSGWLKFSTTGVGNEWRFYILDTLSFRIMTSTLSSTPEYTYTFSPAERYAGEEIYSFDLDLTGDNNCDFYVLSWYGTDASHRQAFRIFNIVNNTTLFEKNDPAYSYTYPSIWDLNGDGLLECSYMRYDYPNTSNYFYEVYQTGVSASAMREPQLPQQIDLHQNYPNPFNPDTRIEYNLNTSGRVRMDVFNLSGQKVQTLVDESQEPGLHSVPWNGASASSGTYFYRMLLNEKPVMTRKMQLVK